MISFCLHEQSTFKVIGSSSLNIVQYFLLAHFPLINVGYAIAALKKEKSLEHQEIDKSVD